MATINNRFENLTLERLQEIYDIITTYPPGSAVWGSIIGTLSAQTDLQTALNNKVPTTRTLTINGTTQDLSANRTWTVGTVTSVAALTLGTTGTDLSSTVANGTTTPVITLNVPTASATNRGALSSTDWSTFNGKFTLPSLTSGSVLFSNGTTIAQNNANFFWDATNNRLGIGTNAPSAIIHSVGSVTASGAIARGNYLQPTLVAAANNDVLIGLDIAPTFTVGAFTGVQQESLVVRGGANVLMRFKNSTATATWGQILATSSAFSINAQAGLLSLVAGNTEAINVFASTRNVVIQNGGTFTDAGYRLDVNGSVRTTGSISAASAIARGTYLNQTLVATANNDTLIALDIIPTYTVGAFTGVSSGSLRIRNATNTGNAFFVDTVGNASLGASLSVTTVFGGTNINLSSGSGNLLLQTNTTANTGLTMFNATRNIVIQNGGTFTDAGYRLDVVGTARFQGQLNSQEVVPASDSTYNLGTSALRYNVVYLRSLNSVTNSLDIKGANINLSDGAGNIKARVIGATGNFLIGTSTDVASSILTVESTTKGFLPPRQTQAQRTAIASPAVGLIVYQTDLVEGLYIYKSTGWTFVI